MTQARRVTTTSAISIADLNTEIDSEPRVLDVVLGERLGMAQPRNIRTTISGNSDELEQYGSICTARVQNADSLGRGRPGKAYYLNEPQALLICMFSNTPRAASVRKMLIDVFMEYRRGQVAPAKPVKVKAHERRTSTKLDNAFSLARSAGRLEKVADTFEPRVQSLSMIVVDGRPVVFDPHATDLRAGDVIVGFDWFGKLIVTPIVERVLTDGYRPGGFRLVSALPQMQGGIRTTPSVFAIGKVVMPDVPQQSSLPLSVGSNDNPSLPGHYRGKRTKFRDDILRLLDTGMTNRQIAQETGATYQTVTHWRRWVEDRAAA